MKKVLYFTISVLVLISCKNNSTFDGVQEQEEVQTAEVKKPKENKPKKINYSGYGNKKYYDEEFEKTDLLIKNTVKGYTYVENLWNDNSILCFNDNERIQYFLKIDPNSLMIVTIKDTMSYLNEYDINFNLIFKHELDMVNNYYFSDFIVYKDTLYFKSATKDHKRKYWKYNRNNEKYTELTNPEFYSSLFDTPYIKTATSPDRKYTVRIEFSDMYLFDHSEEFEEIFIKNCSKSHCPDWCFNNVCWNEKGDKFYFDNSGEIACIWEVDIINKTIDKIVPEHFAEFPVCINDDVFYVEKDCIRKASFISKGKERILAEPGYDTISANSLLQMDYHISEIKDFPEKELLNNTSSALFAVNADRGTYKVKFLYTLNDSTLIETSSMTLVYSDYKCPEPEPVFSKGLIEYNCVWENGYVYGEKFEYKNHKILYDGSYDYQKTD